MSAISDILEAVLFAVNPCARGRDHLVNRAAAGTQRAGPRAACAAPGGKIRELREESQTNIYRLLYFFYTGRKIVFLHGFQKKTQKTPRREIEVAQERLDEFVRRVEGGE